MLSTKPRLRVPHPPARPGEAPDFSYLKLSDAGAIDRPPIDAAVDDIEHLSVELVRVLDNDHMPRGTWNPALAPEQLLQGLVHMMRTRAYDDRMLKVQRQGKISFYVQSRGEEAVSVAQGMALRDGDMLFPTYRNQGLYFARGRPVVDLMCQCLSNARDMCRGRQLPIMYHWKEKNIFTISGNLTTQVPQAVGWAMAAAIKGEDHLACTWSGEGSTAESDYHNALTFATVYQAPVIINVVNNQWAISTFQGIAGGAEKSFAARGPGYNIPGIRVDGNDFLAVYAVTRWAAERARSGGGPTLIEHVTYRAGAHSTSDDPARYRAKNEYDFWPLGDPIERLKNHLIGLGVWSEDQHQQALEQYATEMTERWKEAISYGTTEEGSHFAVDSMFDDVYKDIPPPLVAQREKLKRQLKNQ
ncbi:MAG: 3-methyl-2-oxobutanoate dehydrogenase (2-methylpropanoyl-transferring) subunit alpha [Gammaproteobacteria bacterium]|nr:3-methyl-2-oxobutanoate dehydrogenase (2-methylpropanoyl-transferring) subunit alpha [Gammaproteobacteria bacterium]